MKGRCKTCKWWDSDNRDHTTVADCCVLPPAVLDNVATKGNTFSYKRPRTAPEERCSLYAEDKP